MKITPVILSGGSGTRLWPVSRRLNPKQFLDFFGENSLFQQTVLRVADDKLFRDPVIVCNNEHRFIAAEELKQIKVAPQTIILEPIAKNTAPAIAVAALDVMARNEKSDDIMLVMPSDHIISDSKKFLAQVEKALPAAQSEHFVTFGIVPDRAETGYGYIKHGKEMTDIPGIFVAEKFIEKPQQNVAEEMLRDGGYLWNGGIFMFKASSYLEVLKKMHGEIFVHCCSSYNHAIKDLDFLRLDDREFEKCLSISVDYAVMEKAEKVCVAPIDTDWSDVGSWQTISEIAAKDSNGNSLEGDVIALKTSNCYVNSRSKLVATIGVKDLIIISLKDAVLIIDKNSAQQVKDLFEIMKQQKREECDAHTVVQRPWGSFETVDMSDRFKVKRIAVKPGASLSLQMHNHRAEHWVVVKGVAHVVCGSKTFVLKEDESTYIPVGKKHRLENRGTSLLEIIEVQTGDYLGEDDIVRFSDVYGR